MTIDDPTTFVKPWTIEVPYTKANEKENKIFEAACHEEEHDLPVLKRIRDRERAKLKK